jgi:hypothetical protein
MSHDSHAVSQQSGFSASDVESFKTDDRSSATAVVALMVGIFTIGLALYLGVCYWIMN